MELIDFILSIFIEFSHFKHDYYTKKHSKPYDDAFNDITLVKLTIVLVKSWQENYIFHAIIEFN